MAQLVASGYSSSFLLSFPSFQVLVSLRTCGGDRGSRDRYTLSLEAKKINTAAHLSPAFGV
jgi:hypothetical protein